jgi:lipopolysaccharide export system protein LptC
MRLFAKISAVAIGVLFIFSQPVRAQQPTVAKLSALNVPLPVGQSAKGVHIPVFDEDGKMQMFLNVDAMLRKDDDHLQMTNTKVEIYNDQGAPDMGIDLPVSLLDLNTRVLTSDHSFTMHQTDFELTGDTLEFDTVTRIGKIFGNVKLIIYNIGDAAK